MRRRSYTLEIASKIKENLVFLKPVLQSFLGKLKKKFFFGPDIP